MNCTYLIVSSPEHQKITDAAQQLSDDLSNKHQIKQLFFYSEGVAIGQLEDYPQACEDLMDLADSHRIPLYICSAGFQKRDYQLSSLGEEDFTFKGLGQFIAESQSSDTIRVF